MMRYMVIETFTADRATIYERLEGHGRMLPDGLRYIDSWVAANGDRCFQLMETDDPELLSAWTAKWSDVVDFEVVPLEQSSRG